MHARLGTAFLVGWWFLAFPLVTTSDEHASRLGQLLATHPGVPAALAGAPVRVVTARRAETYVEDEGTAFAGTLLLLDGSIPAATARNLGESACRFVFAREVLGELDTEWVTAEVQQALLTKVVGLKSGEFEFGGFRRLQGSTEKGWVFQTCSVPVGSLERARAAVVRDNTVGVAAYQLGKEYLQRGEREMALALFKQSRMASDVYPNALAFMIPLLWDDAPAIASTLESEYLDPERISDAAAASFLGLAYLARGEREDAGAMFKVCLNIDRANQLCQEKLETLFRLPPWESRSINDLDDEYRTKHQQQNALDTAQD
jgi:tetratricopeptide (TPR) repeat protein